MKIIRVNMTEKSISNETMPPEYAPWGGRGLTAAVLQREIPPTCSPLDAANRLVLAPGLLSGTVMINSSRLSIGAKSPLTGGIKESNAGGSAAAYLGRLGVGAAIIEGASQGWHLLRIDAQGTAVLEPAEDLKGMRTYELARRLLVRYGTRSAVLCIGPAGEQRLPIASIQASDIDGQPCRAAGRGGLGAVMAAKGLKAIVVEAVSKSRRPVSDPAALKKAARAFAAAVREAPFSGKVLPRFGTAALVAGVNNLGGFPCFNATRGEMPGWEKLSGEALVERLRQRGGQARHKGCAQCIIDCSNRYVDKKGNYLTGSLEYETIWSMGGMTGINDLDTIAQLDFLCDDIGLDTMSTGVALAVAMDAGHRSFGDGPAAVAMVEEIAAGTDFGQLLGNGPAAVAKHFGHHRVPVVKNQSIAGYDPRAMQGMAVTYATSPMGADHTAGNLIGAYLSGAMDPLEKNGQIEASRNAQVTAAALDATGLCLFTIAAVNSPQGAKALCDSLAALTGKPFIWKDFLSMGREIILREREFNRLAGLVADDDRLPRFFYDEPLFPKRTVVLIDDDELLGALDLADE